MKVYTETVVHSAPEAYVGEAPYQIAIVILEDGSRVTGRISGERVAIDDEVISAGTRDGVPYFRKATP
ncbi:MAG TPA: OB-fold domain-containing protein [Bryobacteraceae bacterium]|nr:OB-fold domain-containing protein [Bryobacteraceae bacterium]